MLGRTLFSSKIMLPKQIQNLIDEFANLPGIGPKAASRLAFWLLRHPSPKLIMALKSLGSLKPCSICQSLICFCRTQKRDRTKICLVEDDLDLLAIEKTSSYDGLYHVIGSEMRPNLRPLLKRLKGIKEIIIATNPTTEGETTALYIKRAFKNSKIKITRLARGLPTGADLEYADETTLTSALEGRKEI